MKKSESSKAPKVLNFYDQQSESEKVEDISKSLENDLNEAASEVIYKAG